MMGLEVQIRRTLELASRYYGPAVSAANQGRSVYRRLEPQLQRLARQIHEVREAQEDYPRYLLVESFTFARGGWHDAPLAEAPARAVRKLVEDLADKSDDEVKAELDAGIPAYFRDDDHAALWDMIDRWDLYPEWRRQVFEDAFEAHRSGKYTLSVPALAPQIEGILRDETNEYEPDARYIQKINEALGFRYNRREPPAPPSIEDLERTLDDLLALDVPERYREAERISLEHALFRVNELYNNGKFWNPDFVKQTNRHAIVHGVSQDFTELHSVKLFCTVQLVHEIVDGYREATGEAEESQEDGPNLSRPD